MRGRIANVRLLWRGYSRRMFLRTRWVVLFTAVAVALVAVACSGGSPESKSGPDVVSDAGPAVVPGGGGGAPGISGEPAAPGATGPSAQNPVPLTSIASLSPVSLPTRELEFRVRVPDNHPAGDRVVLMTMPPGNVARLERIEMEPDAGEPGVYFGTATVEQGALLRYTYDRWDGRDIDGWDTFRETVEDVYRFVNRYVLVTGEVDLVEDTVAMWRDLPGPDHAGVVTGRVLDAATGEPVIDATISISGVHTASDWQGRFRVANLPDGEHRAVAITTLGDYKVQQLEFDIEDGVAGEEVTFLMAPAVSAPVTFDVALPENTPPDAEIAISGNLWQLGGRPSGYPFQPVAIALPVLNRVDPGRAVVTIDLYEGTYVNYTYTIRSIAEGVDQSDSGPVYRSFIAGDGARVRTDIVERWNNGDLPIVTLRVTVPANTTPGAPVGISTGPTAWMSQTGPYEWVAHLIHNPPGSDFNFGITLSDDMGGADGSPGTVEGRRTVTIPQDGAEILVEVTKWANLPDPTARQPDGALDVTFRVSVPPETPPDATILLTGNRAAVAGGIEMRQRPDNPWVYETTVTFAHDGAFSYDYEIAGAGPSTRSYGVFTGFDGQIVNDWVGGWDGLSAAGADARAGWRSGIFLPDFWSTSFAETSRPLFERVRDVAAGEWVALSSIWSYGRLQPTPTIEQRPVQNWTVLTPLESLKAQAALAHDAGLKVFLAVQQNPEVIPGWNDPPLNVRDQSWWEAWLLETERQWMWNAIAAEEIDAELLMLPGPIFHVFPDVTQFEGDPFRQVFDTRIATLIDQVRGIYGGSILISGSNKTFDFPALADVRGATTYDLGVPQLPENATVAEWKAAYRVNFEEQIDPIRERWDGPVVFYTIHGPSTGSGSGDTAPTGDPFGEFVQANRLEAIYQLVAERPWLQGAFSWSYDYVDVPLQLSDGVRGRLGEAVQAKWYERLSGG